MFFTDQEESFGWATYKDYITRFAGDTTWEGTLRHITESPGRVILELKERNTRDGFTHRSNTVTIYEFGEDEKLRHLDVFVMSLNQAAGVTGNRRSVDIADLQFAQFEHQQSDVAN